MAHAIHSGVISTDPVFVEGRVDDMLLETMERVRYVKNMFGVHNPNPRTRVRRHGWNGIFEYGICEYHQHNSDKNCDTLPNYPNGEN
ncbi:predicted protein [Sclerotinia sclerotiorum 1980 UF-70]|uniref:Uncharacterized protein n=2 Tax=Sclerotinia sclerotiorum (strain ATCC 18683 / 1980 / Ss-1) TaxID=665079 RepID=A7EWY4_SCLS1|nr:predicted protein [Sclerotinia sclerotiorum 1980 UF-70]APA05418.1 hypothetical protein sscle_01g001880 [Sclerotinia sclerotiorum 1980 UF-70]EDN93976.1 predicted protein [Sclerotinia sclerotiorum 1980 UF-70]